MPKQYMQKYRIFFLLLFGFIGFSPISAFAEEEVSPMSLTGAKTITAVGRIKAQANLDSRAFNEFQRSLKVLC